MQSNYQQFNNDDKFLKQSYLKELKNMLSELDRRIISFDLWYLADVLPYQKKPDYDSLHDMSYDYYYYKKNLTQQKDNLLQEIILVENEFPELAETAINTDIQKIDRPDINDSDRQMIWSFL